MWNWFGRKRKLSCQGVEAQLMAYLKGGLSPAHREAVHGHLATCDACARSVREAQALEAKLVKQAHSHCPRLSPQASARIHERVYKRMRRGLIMQRITNVIGKAVGIAAILTLAVGALALWRGAESVREGEPSVFEGERVTITFACPDTQKLYYEELIQTFEAANPDLHVQLISLDEVLGPPLPDGQYEGDSARRLAAAADTLFIPPDPAMVQRGLLHDLMPLIAGDGHFDAEDFYTLEHLQWDGGTWGLPVAVWALDLIFYDKALFDAAGVAYPEPGWTWDDFLRTAQALTEWQGDEVVRWGFVQRHWDPTPFVQGRVGPLVDSSTEPPTPLVDRPAVAGALRWYTDLALVQRVMPSPQLPTSGGNPLASEAAGLVKERRAAMWSESTLYWERWNEGRELGVAPFPVDDASSATTPVTLDAVVMSAGTAHPEASWRWLAFLSRQPPSGEQPPARRSVAQSSGYWERLEVEQAAAYGYALDHALSRTKSALGLGYDLRAALKPIFDGERTVEEVLIELQGQAEAGAEAEQQVVKEESRPLVVATARPEEAAESEGVRIVFVPHDFHAGTDVYKDLAEVFHRSHPDIVVEILADVDGGIMTGNEPLSLVAAKADCFRVFWQTWDSEERAQFLPLDPLLEADASFSLDDFYAPAVEALRLDGQLLALPQTIHPTMMFYNKQVFDAAGLAYPSPDWTLDDFVTLAVALTDGEGAEKRYGYLPTPGNPNELGLFVEQYGARLVDLSTEPPTFRFDDPVTVEAVRWYAALVTEHGVMPETFFEIGTDSRPLWEAAVRSGGAAMWSGYVGNTFTALSRGQRGSVGLAPVPWGPGRVAGFYLQEAFVVSAHTEHPQACWEWLKFLTEQPALFVDAQTGLPARRSVAESTAYREQVGEKVATAYREAIGQGERPVSTWLGANRQDVSYPFWWFGGALRQYIAEGGDVERLLGEVQRKAEAYVVCLETKQGLEGMELAKACGQEVYPDR
jgi:multiple sugar transport system substrate-binding protein